MTLHNVVLVPAFNCLNCNSTTIGFVDEIRGELFCSSICCQKYEHTSEGYPQISTDVGRIVIIETESGERVALVGAAKTRFKKKSVPKPKKKAVKKPKQKKTTTPKTKKASGKAAKPARAKSPRGRSRGKSPKGKTPPKVPPKPSRSPPKVPPKPARLSPKAKSAPKVPPKPSGRVSPPVPKRPSSPKGLKPKKQSIPRKPRRSKSPGGGGGGSSPAQPQPEPTQPTPNQQPPPYRKPFVLPSRPASPPRQPRTSPSPPARPASPRQPSVLSTAKQLAVAKLRAKMREVRDRARLQMQQRAAAARDYDLAVIAEREAAAAEARTADIAARNLLHQQRLAAILRMAQFKAAMAEAQAREAAARREWETYQLPSTEPPETWDMTVADLPIDSVEWESVDGEESWSNSLRHLLDECLGTERIHDNESYLERLVNECDLTEQQGILISGAQRAYRLLASPKDSFSDSVRFRAWGFFNGTKHDAFISNGLYTNVKAKTQIQLSHAQQKEVSRLLTLYSGKFHEEQADDRSPGGDRGVIRFMRGGMFGHPRDMPELEAFFFNLDPSLRR